MENYKSAVFTSYLAAHHRLMGFFSQINDMLIGGRKQIFF